jgi:hypothetical protein
VLEDYVGAAVGADLSHVPWKVRQYLAWLAGAEVDGDPLGDADGRDWAVHDYRGYLQTLWVGCRRIADAVAALARRSPVGGAGLVVWGDDRRGGSVP